MAFRPSCPGPAFGNGTYLPTAATGLHFEPGDPADLATKVRWAVDNPSDMRHMGDNARRVYEDRYTPELNYRQLMAIYDEAVQAAS